MYVLLLIYFQRILSQFQGGNGFANIFDNINKNCRDEPKSPTSTGEKRRKSIIDIRRRRSMHKPVRSPQPTAMYEESELSELEEGQSKPDFLPVTKNVSCKTPLLIRIYFNH